MNRSWRVENPGTLSQSRQTAATPDRWVFGPTGRWEDLRPWPSRCGGAEDVPCWLSVWGLIGATLILVRGVLELYGIDLADAAQGVLTAPIGVNEMVLAVWLMLKGFSTSDRSEFVRGDHPS